MNTHHANANAKRPGKNSSEQTVCGSCEFRRRESSPESRVTIILTPRSHKCEVLLHAYTVAVRHPGRILRISLAFDGSTPIKDTLPAVLAADELGLDGVWSAEHVGLNDGIVPSATYLARTERLEAGIVGCNTDTRHPGLLAMELNSLEQIGPGRVRVQVGTGDFNLSRLIGSNGSGRSLANVESFVRSLRSLLAGERVTETAPGFRLENLALRRTSASPPIDVMAIRPKMLDLASTVGDGVALSFGASHRYLSRVVSEAEETLERHGRQRESFRITAVTAAAVAPDIDTARTKAGKVLAFAHIPTARILAEGVTPLPAEADLRKALQSGGPAAAGEAFARETIDALALVATPDTLADAVGAYADTGIDELAVMLTGSPRDHVDLVGMLAEIREGLAS
jgi:5,10-methylenetetrahydromethanopterin reductase